MVTQSTALAEPLVSVVIPAYRSGNHLGGAIRSVLGQTYRQIELVVVDDASPEDLSPVLRQFDDPRIRFVRHEVNRGANAARNTGIRAASGAAIAFLDQDDVFHPERLAIHAGVLARHPQVGLTYGPRFEWNYSSETIRDIWTPPETISLTDIVTGFPLAPSDMVVRRQWLDEGTFWDEEGDFHGGEITFLGRLYLAGCQFANVGKVLTFRRHHSGRRHGNIPRHCRAELTAQEIIINDVRCPAHVAGVRNIAFSNTHLVWGYEALAQGHFELGREYLRTAATLDSTLLEGDPCRLLTFLVDCSVVDETEDHSALLSSILAHIPPDVPVPSVPHDWAVARGFFLKGLRALAWDRPDAGRRHLEKARRLGGILDPALENTLAHQLDAREQAEGCGASEAALASTVACLEDLGYSACARRVAARYRLNRAFRSARDGNAVDVRHQAIQAILKDPRYLLNRGILSILSRSLLGRTSASAQES